MGGATATSTAPMVHEPFSPAPRATPRWSVLTPVLVHTEEGMAPMAGLPVPGSSVAVGPPLSPSEPSWALWPMMSPVAAVPHVESSIRL